MSYLSDKALICVRFSTIVVEVVVVVGRVQWWASLYYTAKRILFTWLLYL